MEKITTLVVDDNDQLRAIMRTAAELDGAFDVVGEAEDGIMGLAAARWLRPSLVILDVQMPGRTGLDVLPEILAELPAVTVALLSGYEREVLGDLPGNGRVIYVNKNAGIVDIFARLREQMVLD